MTGPLPDKILAKKLKKREKKKLEKLKKKREEEGVQESLEKEEEKAKDEDQVPSDKLEVSTAGEEKENEEAAEETNAEKAVEKMTKKKKNSNDSPSPRGQGPCGRCQDWFRENPLLPRPQCRAGQQVEVHAKERNRCDHHLSHQRAVHADFWSSKRAS